MADAKPSDVKPDETPEENESFIVYVDSDGKHKRISLSKYLSKEKEGDL